MALVKFNGDYTPTLLEKFWNDELNFIDEMFRRPFSMFNGNGMNQYGKINVIDNTDNYTLEVYLPGAGKDDVNVESVRCAYSLGGTPIGNIAINDGPGTIADVAPEISSGPPPTYHNFEFYDYEGQDEWETLEFKIYQ